MEHKTHKAYNFSLNISKSEREPGSMMTSSLVKATSEMQRKSDIVAGKLTPNGTLILDSKDVILQRVANKIIEDVIIEELDELCEDEFCDFHHKWISKLRKRHKKIAKNDSKKKKA